MSRRGWSMVMAAVLAAGGFLAMGYGTGTAGGAAAQTVHSRMLYGPDFQPLDFRIASQFMQNSGGGIYAHLRPSDHYPSDVYLEAGVDLPTGARVTSVSFFYKDCGLRGQPAPWFGDYYFGAYKPSSGAFTYLLPVAHHAYGDCAARYTFTRTGSIATVTGDRRYVLGAKAYEGAGGDVPHPEPLWLLYGARLKYTCPTTCT